MKTKNQVKCKVYDSTRKDFEFPELKINELLEKNDVAIAFSGGGTRSASLTMGQLRALNDIGVLDKVRYLSAVSGGSWGSFPFMFLPVDCSDSDYLGKYLPPSEIEIGKLENVKQGSLSYSISHADILEYVIKEIGAGDERYARIIGDIFLKPCSLNDNEKFVSYNQNSLNSILERNPDLDAENFYLMNPKANRPFPIAGGIIIRPDRKRIPFEMTPLYVGINQKYNKKEYDSRFDIGGGYVETLGFDSDAPISVTGDEVRVNLRNERHRFALSDIIGTSGAAPAEYAERYKLEMLGFPEFKYWSPADPIKENEFDYGDGGILENLGIMPLLKRKVKKIIIFANGSTPLQQLPSGEIEISSSIPALFHPIPNQYGSKHFDENVVFANQEEKYNELVQSLYLKKAEGKPAIFQGSYQVTPQKHHGIFETYQVEILWIYNDIVRDWINLLQKPIQKNLKEGKFGKHFPHFKTFMENPPYLIKLHPEQANLASQLASWNVITNKEIIMDFLNP
jgi:hypothetical protein